MASASSDSPGRNQRAPALDAQAQRRSARRNTALHIAASQGHLHVLFTLVKLGAATNVRNGRGKTPKELLKGTSTTANYDMEIFKGISLIKIMEKYLAAEKGKASLRREYMSFQLCLGDYNVFLLYRRCAIVAKTCFATARDETNSRPWLPGIADLHVRLIRRQGPGRLKRSISFQEEHKAELRNVAENQQEKEAEILRMQNEIAGLKETVASRDEKIKSLEVPAQDTDRGPFQERRGGTARKGDPGSRREQRTRHGSFRSSRHDKVITGTKYEGTAESQKRAAPEGGRGGEPTQGSPGGAQVPRQEGQDTEAAAKGERG
ncbi:hypothetical protein C7M84_024988 [Penaeus vannamei]|uniref:Uncharacterized protein n=1 Tax=Penaeus vannamei TaxID=6689 RepID=A0A3R7QXF8_PENVA|nr:hypothetical protein C7M84_024988 [Penaeus vannamei]